MKPLTPCSALLIVLAAAVLTLLSGCVARPANPSSVPVYRAPVYTPSASGARARPALSAEFTIIHIRPEARDYVHP